MCCHEQPPHVPKCVQNGCARSFENALIAVTRPSRKLLFIFVRLTSTVSPGAPPSIKITFPSTRDTHLPSAAMVSTTIFSIMSPFFMKWQKYAFKGVFGLSHILYI